MRRHIVRPLHRMAEPFGIFRDEPLEEFVEIENHVRVGVLLNRQGCRSVLDEDGKQASPQTPLIYPACDFPGDLVKALAACIDVNLLGEMAHSTVTLLARLRG